MKILIPERTESKKILKNPLLGISFSGLKSALSKTSESLVGSIVSLTHDKQEIDDDLLDEMEESIFYQSRVLERRHKPLILLKN
ncbi:MAG: hypothetical protein MZV64_27805 [Ignavibacteriales bacterium]|nr:hypothetical protein [Ignavibacteriales bacterium]